MSRINVSQPGGGNRDGIDIDSCRDVLVEDSYLASGDDTVAIKSGLDFFGRRYNRPSRDILFRNITTGGGYGISIGSEVSGGIINVTFVSPRPAPTDTPSAYRLLFLTS